MKSARLGSWLLLACSTTLCLALLEVALRWWAPLYPSPFQPDDRLLVRLVPGAQKTFVRNARNGGQRITWRVNRDGFRGAELEPAHGQERIVVYGDSNVAAEFSELGATYAGQLERRLAARGTEVINAGVIGYGVDQVSLRMPHDLSTLKPSLVLVVVYVGNDFGDLLRNRIYGIDARGQLALNDYRLPPALRATFESAAYPRGPRRLQLYRYAARAWHGLRTQWGDKQPIAARFARYIDDSLAKNQQVYAAYLAEDPARRVSDNPFLDYHDADIALLPDSASAKFKIALMRQVLIRLRDTAAQFSARLAVIILPSAIDVSDHYDIQVDASRFPQYARDRLSRTVESMAADAGIPELNLFDAFRARDANQLYFRDGDDHWNDAGQALAAKLTAELIERERLLP